MLNWAIRYAPVVALLDAADARDVLDVGSGWYGLSWFRRGRMLQSDLTFDPSRPSASRPGSPQFLRASVLEMPFASEAFDAVVSLDLFEHLHPSVRPAAMTELTRMARRQVIVGFPLGRGARLCDRALWLCLRLLQRALPREGRFGTPTWLAEHMGTPPVMAHDVPEMVPEGWEILSARRSGNVVLVFVVHLLEAILARPKNTYMPGVDRRWSWPKAFDIAPSYRRIYDLRPTD